MILPERVRDAAKCIIGNLEESGYLTTPLEEIAVSEALRMEDVRAGLKAVQTLDPTGVGATHLQECLLLQLDARGCRDGVAWKIVQDHLKLLETRQYSQLAKTMGRPLEHVQIAVNVIRHLDPAPGLRYSSSGARPVEPDVYITKDGEDYLISLNDDDVPQLRLNGEYKRMIDREQEPNKDVRNYVKGALRVGAAVDQEHRAAETNDYAGVPVDCPAANRFSGARNRPAPAHDDQGGSRGDRGSSFDRQPSGRQQVRAHAAGRF